MQKKQNPVFWILGLVFALALIGDILFIQFGTGTDVVANFKQYIDLVFVHIADYFPTIFTSINEGVGFYYSALTTSAIAVLVLVIWTIMALVRRRAVRILEALAAAILLFTVGFFDSWAYNVILATGFGNSGVFFLLGASLAGILAFLFLNIDFAIALSRAKKAAQAVAAEKEAMEEAVIEEAVAEEAPVEVASMEEKAPAAEEAVIETAPIEIEPVGEETIEEEPRARGASGKYEVFPEAGFFKYRLKANNGQILLVSHSYVTLNGAVNGIETLRKNLKTGVHKVVTDKNGKSQFRIFTANEARLVAAGEIYPNAEGAQNALDSVLHFYETERVVKLDEISEEEIREWRIDFTDKKVSTGGKYEIFQEDNKYAARLLASNGEVLFVTTTYATRQGCIASLDKIAKRVLGGFMSVVCDKQGMYQFKIYADNGMVLVMGETYADKNRAISAAYSVRAFVAGNPRVVAAK